MDITSIYFIIAFAVGIVWYRLLFFFAPKSFKEPLVRSTLKLRWHHMHWGALFVLVGSLLLLYFGTLVISSAILIGLGLGLILDLFVPSLLLETNRERELIAYRKSLAPTLLFAGAVVIVLVVFSLI